MKNRSSYAVLTRFGIIAAILGALVLIASAVSAAGHLEFSYAENGTDPVATFSATDADGDEIEWSLSGVDKDDFSIEGGVLAFKSPPDYEGATDRDEDGDSAGDQGKGDNVYKITVEASGGSQAVEVTVTNVNEDGMVEFTQPQPQVSREIVASFDDDDGDKDPTWQWSMGPSMEGPWTDIAGQTKANRNPTEDEIGSYLRATVSYTDSFGAQTASGVTENPVEARTLANAMPDFGDIDPIPVNENMVGAIGDPVTASDDDNDVLLYAFGSVDGDDADTDPDPNDNGLFSIHPRTGQLSITGEDGLNFEAPGDDPGTTTPKTATTAADGDIPAGVFTYAVVITATDPSGASGTGEVTVYLSDANEPPAFTGDTDDQTKLYIAENGVGSPANGLFTDEALTTAVVAYQATDPDADDTTTEYTLEGAGSDGDSFTLDDSTGALTWSLTDDDDAVVNANFEGKSSYSLVVIASDGDDDRVMHTRLGVTVTVVDNEDAGTVDISAPEPQVGSAVIATLNEPDSGVTGLTWQWFRSADDDDTAAEFAALIDTAANRETHLCDDDNAATTGDPCVIGGGTGPVYTPSADDATFYIYALASYTDDQAATANDTASGKPTRVVQIADPANTAPKFPDQDLVTAGDQSDTAMRSVAENADGAEVGRPVPATDGDLLLYSLSGDDADMFSVVKTSGQIKTATKLDYEALPEDAKYHMVTLTATDPSGATDSIMVVITVTNENDPPMIMGVEEVSVAEGDTDVATFTATDQDGDDIEWDVAGVDAGAFDISEDGVLTFEDAPDFEAKADADEDMDSLGNQGKGDNIYRVTVTASGGDPVATSNHDVAVTVTNVNEDGKVDFDQPQPQATRNLKADFSDQDGEDMPTWQWSRGPSMEGPWTDIAGATMSARRPTADDVDNYLRATVTYTDSFGEQMASGVTENPVEARTLANAAPSFKDDIVVEANENQTGDIGDPVLASDSDNDVLLYSKGTLFDTDGTTELANDNALFDIAEKTGQISIVGDDGVDFETAVTGGKTPNADGTDDGIPDGAITYTFVITATDPSGATGTEAVTVAIKNVNEAPAFTDATKGQTTLYMEENTASTPGLFTDDDLEAGDAVIAYVAEDEDTLDDTITYILEGAGDDEDFFTFTGGTLAVQPDAGDVTYRANYEDQSSYSLTLVASGTDADDDDRGAMYARLAVTVMVLDREDPGKVTINAREPQVGRPVLATLSDPDGGETEISWKWYRGGPSLQAETSPQTLTTLEGVSACDPDATPAVNPSATDACEIGSAAGSALYTPGDDDVGWLLHAVATYKDNIDTDRDTTDAVDLTELAGVSSEFAAQASNPANTAPVFPDQDPNTPGDQSDMAVRSVAENDKGANVGEAVSANDTDGDALMFALIGDDADKFDVDNNGQITTAVELDYEALPEDAKYHMVTLMAQDPSGASDSILVQINVTDADDGAVIVLAGGGPTEPDHPCVAGGALGEDATMGQASDCQILLDGMAELVGDGTALNWSADTPIGDWQGVSSRGGTDRVYSIYLRGHGLAGEIPDGFNGLDALTSLQLHDNDLTGEIPDLSDLDNLMNLVLNDNMLSGSVPATLGDMAELDYLYLHRNDLSGSIPAELGNATRLRRIWLHGNDLTGSIPAELGNLSDRLRYLVLSSNMLTGEIPAELGNAIHLKQIYLDNNMLSGAIPAELGSIMDDSSTLQRLYLRNNMLTGDIPMELGNLVDLTNLRLSGNMLTGCVPADIADAVDDGLDLAACP